MAETLTKPAALAAMLTKALGKPISDKAVRGMARRTIGRFDKVRHEAYQSHEYTAAEVKHLTLVARARGSVATMPKPMPDSTARAKRAKPAKPATVKAATVKPVATVRPV